MKRRDFLTSATATLVVSGGGSIWPRAALAAETPRRLQMPPLIDTRVSGKLALVAQAGNSNFLGGKSVQTAGYSQGYLGPTVIMQNGELAAGVGNTLGEPVSVHWHGMKISGDHDGGPHQPVLPGEVWKSEMLINQAPATIWYHSHIHERTAQQVYNGLAGVIHVTDGRDDDRGLPSAYGIDDLTLVLQDRSFDSNGRMVYEPSMMDRMHGFHGNRMLVNGQSGTVAAVPNGVVRLRLLNGSNARIYSLFFNDERPMHLVATDGGFLPQPIALDVLQLAPGERAEILVDFAGAGTPVLMSDPGQAYGVLDFAIDETLPARITSLPDKFGDPLEELNGLDTKTRTISLDMGMGMMMGSGGFAINGQPFDMDRIDFNVALGSVERWIIRSSMVAHPFHVHGVQFRVLSEDGAPPRPENSGWKDTVLVPGETEILARFEHPASRKNPFMLHCHILEHEDAGMMAQFTVS
ncbi:multicopper oxidase domain-containing protein [Hoeflea sp. Naph1]|uniref:multicopper oxidase domain-containing protein n=1 Tax=Hoeflea sp. Naph1 TaxID=3388653 RepID=UPI00399036F9